MKTEERLRNAGIITGRHHTLLKDLLGKKLIQHRLGQNKLQNFHEDEDNFTWDHQLNAVDQIKIIYSKHSRLLYAKYKDSDTILLGMVFPEECFSLRSYCTA